jgi:polyhydroxyalkanoate synthesis repressor PhaR
MIRLIKRYESRKLYDTEESRYVSLEEISKWIREGQEVKVIDNANTADVTAQTLTQIILDEGRRGTSFLPTDLLHELVRAGERAVSSGVEQVQSGVDRFVQASIDRFGPVRRAREEMSTLRSRLEQLESSLSRLEAEGDAPAPASATRVKAPRKAAARRGTKAATKSDRSAQRGEPERKSTGG